MHLVHRPGLRSDFERFFFNCFPFDRNNSEERSTVEREWNVFLDNDATLTMVVEDVSRCPAERLVGLAQTVFVSDAFVEYILQAPPYPNRHASGPLPDGTSPLLSTAAVRKANESDGVTAYTTHWTWAMAPLDDEEQRCVRDFIDRTYRLYYTGYRYKRHLMCAIGEWSRCALRNSGFGLLRDYAEHYAQNPPARPDGQISLFGICREAAREEEGSSASRLFAYFPPRFGFRAGERELLFHALLGRSDEEIAAWLSISTHAVKKRWARVFSRVEEVDPSLLPCTTDNKRGAEKRSVLMQIIRERPEEIRPVIARPDLRPADRL